MVSRINLNVVAVSRLNPGDSVDHALWLPTTALPGSKEKIEVMADRAKHGLPLFHPLDAELVYGGSSILPNSDSAPIDLDSRIGSDLEEDTINQAG
jgi:hypothetical protein